MNEKWSQLSPGQKVLLCIQPILIVLFIILYSTVGRQQVLHYHGEVLRCTESEAGIVYAGKWDGRPVSFTVRGGAVEYRYNDRTLRYAAIEDPTAVPAFGNIQLPEITRAQLIGVEIRKEDKPIFRGGWLPWNDSVMVYNEDGSMFFAFSLPSDPGTLPDDPNASDILRLVYAPGVTRRANPLGLLCGIILCVTCIVSLLFADYFFRRKLSFRIRNPEDAEPSDWELSSRWIGWLTLTGIAIFLFTLGLTGM